MLKLSLHDNQQLRIGDNVVLVIEAVPGNRHKVTVCADAPREIGISREPRTIWPKSGPRGKGGPA